MDKLYSCGQSIGWQLIEQVHALFFFFFFLNQQFITRHTVADYGSYFITIYNRSRLHEETEKEREKKSKKRTKAAN